MNYFNPIINTQQLFEIFQNDNIRLIEVSNNKFAKKNYEEIHLQNASFIDVNSELSTINIDLSIGGRHPLPSIKKFLDILSNYGISNDSHVILYDRNNGANAAARLWWMLKAIGHEKVQVLDGGFQEAVKNNFPISNVKPITTKAVPIIASKWKLPLVDINFVRNASLDSNYSIIDVRESKRFLGEFEPIDLIAGHIPNAINITFSENLDHKGLFLNQKQIKHKYIDALHGKDLNKIIIHCGSGVTACHSILAFYYAGLPIPSLYVGSWSEWSRNINK